MLLGFPWERPRPTPAVARAAIPRFGVVFLRPLPPQNALTCENLIKKKYPRSAKTPPKSTKTTPKDGENTPKNAALTREKNTPLQKIIGLRVSPEHQQRRELPLWPWLGLVEFSRLVQVGLFSGRSGPQPCAPANGRPGGFPFGFWAALAGACKRNGVGGFLLGDSSYFFSGENSS